MSKAQQWYKPDQCITERSWRRSRTEGSLGQPTISRQDTEVESTPGALTRLEDPKVPLQHEMLLLG